MNFNPSNFVSSLDIMAKGMLGIFIVIGVIILVTMAINRIFKEKSE